MFNSSASLLLLCHYYKVKLFPLNSINGTVQKALVELETCPYDAVSFQGKLETIQMAVDQLNLENYVNLPFWVQKMNQAY